MKPSMITPPNETITPTDYQYCLFFNKRTKQNVHKIGDVEFQVDERYTNLQALGKGSFGFVCSSFDILLKQPVAIKKVSNAFRSSTSAERLFREILMLRQFQHENILELINIERPNTPQHYDDVYLVTELMSCDLHRLIYSNVCFNERQIKNILYQIVVAVAYLHHYDVLHRDLKPSNIFVDLENGLVKLGDFGLSTKQHEGMEKNVVTRWYRAPELTYPDFSLEYDKSVDVWSIGCIFAEFLLRKPLFNAKDNGELLRLIVNFLGTPNNFTYMNEETRIMFKNIGFKKKTCLRDFFGNINPLILDLIKRMLKIDPRERITARDAVLHPFFKGRFDAKDLDFATVDFSPYEKNNEQNENIASYRVLVQKQIQEIRNSSSFPLQDEEGGDDENDMDETFMLQMKKFIQSDNPLADNHNLTPNIVTPDPTTRDTFDEDEDDDEDDEDDDIEIGVEDMEDDLLELDD